MINLSVLRESWSDYWWPSFAHQCRGPAWLQYVWTALFSVAIAVVITAMTWLLSRKFDWEQALGTLRDNTIVALAIGYSIHLLFRASEVVVGGERLAAMTGWRRISFLTLVPVIGVFVGYTIGFWVAGANFIALVVSSPRIALSISVFAMALSFAWYGLMANKARLAAAEAGREREKARATELQRLAVDAQLRTLQAQIEPHFLFNTLANVASLIENQPAQARLMLEELIELLRASLAATRVPSAALGREVRILTAYLEILRLRMSGRLRYSIDVPEELENAAIPPLSLQPLVENAVRHGLEPKVDGGTVRVVAHAAGDRLEICIEDDGLGFAPRPDLGFGLINLRDRLAALHGDRARLVIEEGKPGTRVRLSVPLQRLEGA